MPVENGGMEGAGQTGNAYGFYKNNNERIQRKDSNNQNMNMNVNMKT